MGLLKRKQQAPVIGSRNPTGLPTAHREPESSLTESSRMAAQAAASLAHAHQQQPQHTHTAQPQQRPAPQRRLSRPIVHSTSSKSIASQKKRNSYISASSSPVYTRTAPQANTSAAAAIAASHDMSMDNLSLNDHTKQPQPMASPINLASLAAQSAALSSSEFLAPPHAHRPSDHSSPSSLASSIRSIDSPPFHAKLGGLPSRSEEFFGTLNRSGSVLSDFDPKLDFGDEFEWLDRSNSSIRSASSITRHGKPPVSGMPMSMRHGSGDVTNYIIDEYDELYENEESSPQQNLSPSPIPNIIPEDRGRQFSTTSIDETQYSDVDISKHAPPSMPIRKPALQRKPPPVSPNRILTSDNSSLMVPQSIPPRAPSPRRKPPPGFTDDGMTDDSTLMNDSMAEAEYEDEEVLPQYPLTSEDVEKRKHHRSLRKGAKKIFKKGLKGTSSYTPSNFLNESDASLNQTVGGFMGLGSSQQQGSKPVQLKTTMRKEKKKEVFNEDKPWKHHTDTEFISESERKRYEGVWVSNKGLYMERFDPETLLHDTEVPGQLNTALKASMMSMKSEIGAMEANLMANVTAQNIWSRSRLPVDTLQKVWELVDTRHDGTLDKTSFIVGTWLVDQCLYGRKLPREVPEAVWNSVTHNGLNVVVKKKKK